MSSPRITPKLTLRMGIGISIVGALLVILLPSAVDALFVSAATSGGQEVQAVIEVALRVIESILPPLGAALIGAALVMIHREQSSAV